MKKKEEKMLAAEISTKASNEPPPTLFTGHETEMWQKNEIIDYYTCLTLIKTKILVLLIDVDVRQIRTPQTLLLLHSLLSSNQNDFKSFSCLFYVSFHTTTTFASRNPPYIMQLLMR